MYLTHQWELQTGFQPYDSRKRYTEGDKIVVRLKEQNEPAEVVRVSENALHKDGFICDQIDIHLLSQAAMLNGQETKSFVAHDQAKIWADVMVSSFEVIREQDETEVIPKILPAISSDGRFVAFQDKWLLSGLLITDVLGKLDSIRKIVAGDKQALTTSEILDRDFAGAEEKVSRVCLEFSINYFLQRDKKRFVRVSEPATKWDLRKPPGSVSITTNKANLSDGKLRTSFDLNLLLFYHGFIGECVFSFPYNRKIMAYHHISDASISGDEFVHELAKLSEHKEYKVEFGHPERRGDPICVSTPDEPKKIQSTVTIKQEWLADGVLKVPKRLSSYMEGTNTVHILYDQVEETLPYEENDRIIEGVGDFYSKKAIAEFDKVHLRLESIKPTRLFIHSSWKVSLDKLLRIEPQDLDWEQSSVRDCIIVVLAKFRTPAHYREIYAEIAVRKHVSLGAIIGTLSRYSPSVFVHVGSAKWQLVGWAEPVTPPEHGPKVQPPVVVINDEIWKAVTTIEENDYVYKLLEKIRKPLSFDEICDKLADYIKVDVHGLRATGFLKADERLRRLDNGTWALEEWFKPKHPPKEIPSKKTPKIGLFWLLLIILLILLFVSGGSMLVWLLIYRS